MSDNRYYVNSLNWYKYTSLTNYDTLHGQEGVAADDGTSRLEGMLIAYGDDSSDRKKATVFSVAVVLGASDQWGPFKALGKSGTGGFRSMLQIASLDGVTTVVWIEMYGFGSTAT